VLASTLPGTTSTDNAGADVHADQPGFEHGPPQPEGRNEHGGFDRAQAGKVFDDDKACCSILTTM
jgi:hypothetical protein